MKHSKRLTDIPLSAIGLCLLAQLLVAALLPLNAFASANWPNEPAGSTQYVDCPFSNSICSPLISQYRSETYTSSDGPLSPPYVLDDHLAAGASTGGGNWYNEQLPNAKEIYVGAWWSTNADFVGSCNGTNKIFFVKDHLGNNSFLTWRGPSELGAAKTLGWGNQTSYSNAKAPGWDGDPSGNSGWFWPNVGDGSVKPGSGWHRIELYLRASTTTSSYDGIIRWWLDGRLVGNVIGVNQSPEGFTIFCLNHTWDGSYCMVAPARDMSKAWHHYWDHLRISFPNGAPDPVLPLAITSPLQTSAQVGKSYSVTLGAENGKAPYAWTISAGSLPPGLTLNKTTGVLSGIPTTIGRSDFTIKVMDSSVPATEATKAFTIIVSRSTGIGRRELAVNGSGLTVESRMGSVRFHLPQSGAYALSVYDLAGKKVYENKAGATGQKEMRIETALKNGIYFARFGQGREMSTVRFNVMN